jgi:xanthine dehydrogenase molybdenum-binding subunit
MPSKYRYIGQPTPRKDARDIVTGRAKYVADLTQQRMLYGKVLRSPHAHANIIRIDTSKAKNLPGVRAVLTHADIPDWMGGTPRHVRVLDTKVRYVGDAVALVAADTEQIAIEALDLIDVEYEVLPAVFTVDDALKPDAPQLYDQFPGNVVPLGCSWFGPNSLQQVVMGDVEAGFAEADFIVEGTFSYENIPNPLPPEPPAVIAEWNSPTDVTIHISTQSAHTDKTVLYVMMGRKVNVHAIGCQTGSSFGSKMMSWQLHMHAISLAKAAGRPVKMAYTKEEHFSAFTLRLGTRLKGKVGIKKDGTVTAISGDWLVGTGFYCHTAQAQIAVGAGEAQLMLRCPNWDVRPTIVCANRPPSGIVRGFGGQELKSAIIPMLSIAMAQADVDPLEFFKNNYVKPGDGYFWRDGSWEISGSPDFRKAMDEGAKAFGWNERWKGWLKPTSVSGNKRRGVGVALHGNADVGESVSEAFVRIDGDASAVLYSSIAEQGTGQRSNLLKMVAEVLQLPLERVQIAPTDPLINPYETGSVGSRGTFALGSAVIDATEDAKRKLFEFAAAKLKVAPEDLETEDGMIFVRQRPDVKIPWRGAIGFERTIIGYGRFEGNYTKPNCLMLFAEVEVDTDTGQVDLKRVLTTSDVGQIIDPASLKNQLDGCLGSGGLDTALFEETILDQRTGHVLNNNMIDYKWRTFADLPAMQHVILETPFDTHRFGAVGVGECSTSPGPPAVLMAVSNAIGSWFHDYPLTPDKILKALGKSDTKAEGQGAKEQ